MRRYPLPVSPPPPNITIDSGKEAVNISMFNPEPPVCPKDGTELWFIMKEFARQNGIALPITKPFSLVFEMSTSELVGTSVRRIFKLVQHGTKVVSILLELGNQISISFMDEYILTQAYLTPGKRTIVTLTFHENIISVLVDANLVGQAKVEKKAAMYLEKALIIFGGHEEGQKYEHQLFKGVIYGLKAVYPAVEPLVEGKMVPVPLETLKLFTEYEPIDTIEELYNFNPIYIQHMNPTLAPLKFRGASMKKIAAKRTVLVCHDTPAIEDSHLYGDKMCSYGYRFRFWQNVDYFCYFGHHLVAIPPPGYITVAHREGVKILGAFVTEPGKGETFNDIILKDLEPTKGTKLGTDFYYANKLVEICKAYGFDGYLMNFEARILPELFPKLLAWVQYLRFKIKSEIPHAEIVWYDSIIENGTVRWQSMLNARNKLFLDVSDKFFTDYHWGLDNLKISVASAKERSWDVMFGNDVYGRGTYGGGRLNTFAAIDEIMKHPLSIAIFGQAYFYQNGISFMMQRQEQITAGLIRVKEDSGWMRAPRLQLIITDLLAGSKDLEEDGELKETGEKTLTINMEKYELLASIGAPKDSSLI
eukprot:TRINITY_DN826_c0_g1_i1.p1 TRINITY_DN826_c0_g1~~TRINITY_DN826_c0_g1_i1.p1  ORF type:complete len:590 (+),score=46.84 TRINITY_DN826_c0_g1_i1:109-1878(+)